MFNVDEKSYEKHSDKFLDTLAEVAEVYNRFEKDTNEQNEYLLYFNEHLKVFPIIDYWRKEIFYIWDVCRESLICCEAINEEFIRNLTDTNSIHEKVYFHRTLEYYMENITYRMFPLLEKIAQMVNQLMSLNIKEKDVSFYKVKEAMINKYTNHTLTSLFKAFESKGEGNKALREYRHALTHRRDPLQPYYKLKDYEAQGLEDGETELSILKINVAVQMEAERDPQEMLSIIKTFYFNLTDFVEKLFLGSLEELIKRYEDEVDYSENQLSHEPNE
ncbi:Cthe_2314 family HEPN domain-containing protein [Priestia megaterium]|uniref:Cthe_2314 family HEPN domain-containing protein n=1 Tax=Priestia megaterium TaxID=1404 RepID=UPI0012D9B2DC|nr:Cthe_2314 family HEPN domain-containing protein [Priestia megaterium]MUL29476.1 hypothetical protein [Priestia megaterium]